MSAITFTPPRAPAADGVHHSAAATENKAVSAAATAELLSVLDGNGSSARILMKAAAGAGKSYALRKMVDAPLDHPRCTRVALVAFANKQIYPLAEDLGRALGRSRVCLYAAKDRLAEVPESVRLAATVESDYKEVSPDVEVIVATTHKLEGGLRWLGNVLPPAANGEKLFDVLFVDEAWQLPLHRYQPIERAAPISVGVGDVGQLPPLDPGQNPWRGDLRHNPYRAWPTSFDNDANTWSMELPAVWRPTAHQLGLWRAFYRDWDRLDCVAAAEDRSFDVSRVHGSSAPLWAQVATGVPTLVEVDGLPEAEAPDVDQPLLDTVAEWLDQLLAFDVTISEQTYDDLGNPKEEICYSPTDAGGRTVIAVLATRNQAVDDATAMVGELTERFGLADGVIQASTVDAWQGRTNAITIAIHPLSGASALDEFNSAFGRLAVTCTRATHALLLVSRPGLDDLLAIAPARPGTPLGEPGTRQLPRQTHQRILATFARGGWSTA
jgi:hypothetical protein